MLSLRSFLVSLFHKKGKDRPGYKGKGVTLLMKVTRIGPVISVLVFPLFHGKTTPGEGGRGHLITVRPIPFFMGYLCWVPTFLFPFPQESRALKPGNPWKQRYSPWRKRFLSPTHHFLAFLFDRRDDKDKEIKEMGSGLETGLFLSL